MIYDLQTNRTDTDTMHWSQVLTPFFMSFFLSWNSSCAVLLFEQAAQTTRPQCRQWCFRLILVKDFSHSMHLIDGMVGGQVR